MKSSPASLTRRIIWDKTRTIQKRFWNLFTAAGFALVWR